MKEPKPRKGASSRPKAGATKLNSAPQAEAEVPVMVEPANLRAVMNAHGARLLGALGQQMNAHLNSLAVFEGASHTLTFQCRNMVTEIGKLLEALEQYQGAHADAVTQATVLRRLVAEFAQHVCNSQALGITD